MVVPWLPAVLRLTGLLAGVGLATSRLGLLAHELGGHAGVAVACGGRVLEVGLFWFAGGWIRYALDEPTRTVQLAVALGGIAIELIIGLALWIALARATGLGGRVVRAIGAALVVHAAWYLATGTYHGYGDGVLLHRELGDAREWVAFAAGGVAVAAAYDGARSVLGALAAAIPGRRAARIAGVAIAVLLAGGLQVGLALGEVRLRGDAVYGAIMERERDRTIARELAEWQRDRARRGLAIDEAERARHQRELAAQHREPPFGYILAAFGAIAIVAGAWRARPGRDGAVPGRVVALACAAAVASVAIVVALGALFA